MLSYRTKTVETMFDAVFVRNGVDYSASEAAKHLRRKREATKDAVRTAEKFIDLVASKSSITGEEYTIRFSDGRTTSAKEFLRMFATPSRAGRTNGFTRAAGRAFFSRSLYAAAA